ncbi:hypothetical protein F1654_02740 [Alkalicaulis satelles]|uniref:Uncharacterized protein n=1 Tax=Alkalicaulis satelles TaxID=2609175 RepID=A0A5M6ZJD8_9PROT|nr:hypothetical protein [Alkalicaulis satelles]KAA5804932.1 hypothetical protein F1654_02740 [Alkalicaulis satelles]
MTLTVQLRQAERGASPRQPVEMGAPASGEEPSLLKGVKLMWFLPVSFSLDMKKTRTSWRVRIRVFVMI